MYNRILRKSSSIPKVILVLKTRDRKHFSERWVKFVGNHSRGRQKGQEAQGRSRRLRPVFCMAEEIGNRRLRKAKVYTIYLSKQFVKWA